MRCCARAAIGHAAAAPPSSVMNSRRFMGPPSRLGAGHYHTVARERCRAVAKSSNDRSGVKGGPSTVCAGCPDYAPQAHIPAALSFVSEVPTNGLMHRSEQSLIRSPRRRGRAAWAAREAERLRGLEIDHQFVLGRRLHRQVGRLLALEDAIDVAGRAAVLVDEIRPIGDQAAGGDEESFVVDRGQFVPGRQRDDQIAMNAPPPRSPSRSDRHSASARKPRRRARSRARRAR